MTKTQYQTKFLRIKRDAVKDLGRINPGLKKATDLHTLAQELLATRFKTKKRRHHAAIILHLALTTGGRGIYHI